MSVLHINPEDNRVAGLIYLVTGLIVFHQVFDMWFLSDDLVIFNLISFNPFGYVEGGFFRPLTDFTNWLTFKVFGYAALPYKLGNLLLHIVNSWLVMLIARVVFERSEVLRSRSFYNWLPLVTGMMFLIWPIRSETVFWGAGRASSLSFCFAALALLAYFRYRNGGKAIGLTGGLVSFFLALFCYESIFSLPLVVLAFEIWFRIGEKREKPDKPSSWYPVIGFFVILGVYLAVRCSITSQLLGGYGSNLHTRFNLNILRNVLVYPFKIMIGAGLYSKVFFFSAAVLVSLIFSIVKLRFFSRNRWTIPSFWGVLMTAMYLASLPVLNLSMSVSDTQFDRYLYWPSLFMILVLIVFFGTIIQNARTLKWLFIVLGIYALSTTYIQGANWQKASHQVKAVLTSINSLEKRDGRLIILNLPDHYCGAYLLRNGIHEGINFLCPETNFRSVHLIGMHPIFDLESRVEVTEVENNLQVKLGDSASSFFYEERSSDFFMVKPISDNHFEIEFSQLNEDDVVVYWSEGLQLW